MAKKKKTKTADTTAASELQAQSEFSIAAGRYANHIQLAVLPEEFALDFMSKVGDHAVHHARIFVTPMHAERLRDLLTRSLEQYEKRQAEQQKKAATKH